jgi:hypothetical protein
LEDVRTIIIEACGGAWLQGNASNNNTTTQQQQQHNNTTTQQQQQHNNTTRVRASVVGEEDK